MGGEAREKGSLLHVRKQLSLDVIHLWEMLPGEEIIGYCDDELGNFLDRIDLDLRTEVASLYPEILNMPGAVAEIMIVRDAMRGDQRIDELYI
ncbi:MAG: hypothetical protein ACOH2J_09845 [Allorhizobium sp.]